MHILLPFLFAVPFASAQIAAGGGGAVTSLVATQSPVVSSLASLETTALGTWPLGTAPKPGTIGLGTIQGEVGVVKTKTG
ncbi:hypothetical protein M430DRAFT_18817 [Amorphotheca resinae ATCC 22711]|uniref:Uncharacterized protein n=1 Tax=Amorphotheca resinae ATCC 22711 TaxID=857342 RepID=A0A2T3B4T7_AMORE|nr:hypothetical protein M430DRAFT_18817 [Amorphotheca resinae ATCC 22711]PSS20665.1 hypothetical protein M430DRAFT_18817 [Amorphotheca resinae ATCC 22711]